MQEEHDILSLINLNLYAFFDIDILSDVLENLLLHRTDFATLLGLRVSPFESLGFRKSSKLVR